jgi:hypothetical protein
MAVLATRERAIRASNIVAKICGLLPYFFHARRLRKRRRKSVPTNPQTSHTQLDMKAYFRPASPQNSAIRVYLNNKVIKKN